MKTFMFQNTIRKEKRQSIEREKVFANHVSDKALVFRKYK